MTGNKPRPLKYPLREPNYPVGVSEPGSIDNPQFSWNESNPDARVDVILNMSLSEYIRIASAVDVGRDIAYNEESEAIWYVWNRAFVRVQSGNEQPTNQSGDSYGESQQYYTVGDIDELIDQIRTELEEELMALQIQKINGVSYLTEVCCGGQVSFYQLTPVGIGADGEPVSEDNGGGSQFGGSTWDGIVPVSAEDCYAESATTYLMERAADFTDTVINWTSQGLDALAGSNDEIVNVGLLTSDLIVSTPNLSEIQSYIASTIRAALLSAAVTDPLEAAWTLNGTVYKTDLLQWVNSAPWLVNGVPVRSILETWIDYSLLIGMNGDLRQLAASCASGNPIPDFSLEAWEIDLTTITSLAAAGLNIDSGQGTFAQGVGVTAVNVGQFNISLWAEGLSGQDILQVGWVFDADPNTQAYVRPVIQNNPMAYGTAAQLQVDATADNWKATPGTVSATNPSYGVFFNDLAAARVLERMRLYFDGAVSLPSPWYAIDPPV